MNGVTTAAQTTPARTSSDGRVSSGAAFQGAVSQGKQVERRNEQQAASDDHQLPEFVHQYLRDYIALADQKAAFVLASVSAILAYLVSSGALQPLKDFALTGAAFSWGKFIGMLACGFLSTAAILAIWVVVPRIKSGANSHKGFVFWKEIIAFGRAEDTRTQSKVLPRRR